MGQTEHGDDHPDDLYELGDGPGPTIEEWLAEDVAYLRAQAGMPDHDPPAPTLHSAFLDLAEALLAAMLVVTNTVLRGVLWLLRRAAR